MHVYTSYIKKYLFCNVKWWHLLGFFLFSVCVCTAKENDITFLREKVILNYPGFDAKTTKPDFDRYVDSVIRVYSPDTFKILSSIVNLFCDQHLRIYEPRKSIKVDSTNCRKNLLYINSYLQANNPKYQYEGYWVNDYNNCVIGVKRISKIPLIYIAYVVEQNTEKLIPGTILGRLEYRSEENFNTSYISPFTGSREFLITNFRNDSICTTGADGKWKKLKKYRGQLLRTLSNYSNSVSGYVLNKSTYYIRVPSSTVENTRILDNLIKAEYNRISSCQNLIIDIRNNVGGTIKVFEPLYSFVCTNPIKKPDLLAYCTEDDVKNTISDIQKYIEIGNVDSVYLDEWQAMVKLEMDNIGKFIKITGDTIKCDSVRLLPKNVGVIINYACQSAAELFLLDVLQSKKVTLFGEHTMGAVDYLDFYPMELPSKRYRLYMPITKRQLANGEEPLDGRGIYPQVSISDSVKDWANFVNMYYGP